MDTASARRGWICAVLKRAALRGAALKRTALNGVLAGWLAMVLCLIASDAEAQTAPGTVVVNQDKPLQVIMGFGGFGAKNMWWKPPPHYDEEFLRLIVDELGTSIWRTQIYWDGEPTNDDASPDTFHWPAFRFGPPGANQEISNNGQQLPLIRELGARGVRIIASVWSPPPWMKEGVDNTLAPFCNGQCGGTLSQENYAEFAEYLAAYVLTVKRETGVEIWALSVQNEPLFANPFESCTYTAKQYAELLRVVGARFRREGLSTRLFGPEHMGDYETNDDKGLFAALLDDPATATHLGAYAVHSYLDGVASNPYDPEGWTKMAARVNAAGKPLWMTETSDGDHDAEWSTAWDMTRHLHAALKYGQVNAWIYWTYAERFLAGSDKLPLFHLLRGWFQFVRPGFQQVHSASSDPDVLVTAFKRRDSLTLLLLNDAEVPQQVQLRLEGALQPETLQVFRASRDRGFEQMEDHIVSKPVELPAQTVTTLVSMGASGTSDLPADLQWPEIRASGPARLPAHGCSRQWSGSYSCSCRLGTAEPPAGLLVLLLLGAGATLRRQRRHRVSCRA